MENSKIISLTPKQRELVRSDRHIQYEIATELGMASVTIYQWASYHPERLAKVPAAMRIINKRLKAATHA